MAAIGATHELTSGCAGSHPLGVAAWNKCAAQKHVRCSNQGIASWDASLPGYEMPLPASSQQEWPRFRHGNLVGRMISNVHAALQMTRHLIHGCPSVNQSNFDVFDWQIPEDQYEQLCRLEPQVRMVDGGFLLSSNGEFRFAATKQQRRRSCDYAEPAHCLHDTWAGTRLPTIFRQGWTG